MTETNVNQADTGRIKSVAQVVPVSGERLLSFARRTGLRQHIQGVNAADARALLVDYVGALFAALCSPTDDEVQVWARRHNLHRCLNQSDHARAAFEDAQAMWIIK